MSPPMTSLTLFSPAGVLAKAAPLKLAAKRLKALGFEVQIDASALAKQQRFAGDDETRLAALHRVADQAAKSTAAALARRGSAPQHAPAAPYAWPAAAPAPATHVRLAPVLARVRLAASAPRSQRQRWWPGFTSAAIAGRGKRRRLGPNR